jgi:thiamine-phosphate pyrophosphorylase
VLPRLYPIVDTGVCRERRLDPVALLDAFLAGGARLVQLRDKSSSTRDRLALADAAVIRTRAAGAQLIVNDRADVARLSGADGVHVGQDDLSVDDVRRVLGRDAIVGLSTHTTEQVDTAARTTATYIAVGPIFGTATKDTGYAARGLDLVGYASRRLRSGQARLGRPIVAIGGITLDRVPDVLAAGATSIAVISDLLTEEPARRVRDFLELLDRVRLAP